MVSGFCPGGAPCEISSRRTRGRPSRATRPGGATRPCRESGGQGRDSEGTCEGVDLTQTPSAPATKVAARKSAAWQAAGRTALAGHPTLRGRAPRPWIGPPGATVLRAACPASGATWQVAPPMARLAIPPPLPAALRRWGVNSVKVIAALNPAPHALVAWERKPVCSTGFANPSHKATGARDLRYAGPLARRSASPDQGRGAAKELNFGGPSVARLRPIAEMETKKGCPTRCVLERSRIRRKV